MENNDDIMFISVTMFILGIIIGYFLSHIDFSVQYEYIDCERVISEVMNFQSISIEYLECLFLGWR